MTLTKTDRARVIHPAGGGIVRRSAQVLVHLAPSEVVHGAKEPTAPTASRNTVPNPGTWLACLLPPRFAMLFN